jgi:hypothetical protein
MTAERGWLIELADGTVCGPVTDNPSTAMWQSNAQEFVAECEKALWSDASAKALTYLREKRGLAGETGRAWRLGYWHGDGKIGGWRRGSFVCRGIVIPWLVSDGAVWRVRKEAATGPRQRQIRRLPRRRRLTSRPVWR